MQYTPLVKRHIRQARLYASHSPVISPKVGCVITMESDVLTYGWNEDLRQLPNYKASGSSGRAIHAEESAILKAVNNPHISLVGTTLFSTRAPCWVCGWQGDGSVHDQCRMPRPFCILRGPCSNLGITWQAKKSLDNIGNGDGGWPQRFSAQASW